MDINEVWDNLKKYEGKIFHTISGLELTYKIKDDIFYPSRTKYNISKKDFEKALSQFPIKGPGEISSIVRGPAYIYAVLSDSRIIG